MTERPSWTPTLLKCAAAMAVTIAVCSWFIRSLAQWIAEKIPGWLPDHPLRRFLLWLLERAWIWGILFGLYTGLAVSLLIVALDARKGRLPPWK